MRESEEGEAVNALPQILLLQNALQSIASFVMISFEKHACWTVYADKIW